MRVFFGHLFTSDALDIIIQRINILPRIDGKLVERQNLHLTIGFIGEIDNKQLNTLSDVADNVARLLPLINITISQFTLIPNNSKPRVLALAIRTDHVFQQLQQSLDQNLRKINIKLDCKPPHLTVARLKSWSNIILPHNQDIHLTLKNFSLIKSDLSSQGPTYTILKSFTLS
jgi:RNA 2',3'-cyclic 3'-phosphodiesterase